MNTETISELKDSINLKLLKIKHLRLKHNHEVAVAYKEIKKIQNMIGELQRAC